MCSYLFSTTKSSTNGSGQPILGVTQLHYHSLVELHASMQAGRLSLAAVARPKCVFVYSLIERARIPESLQRADVLKVVGRKHIYFCLQ